MTQFVATGFAAYVRRIYGEYLEMPGLRLTCAQAQRLWGLDASTCLHALEVLVNEGFLRRTESGQYLRLTEGAAGLSRPRMVEG